MENIGRSGNQPKDEATVPVGEETLQLEGEQPSGEKPEPSPPPRTYSQEQVEKLVSEKHSKLDKRLSELEKLSAKSAKAVELATKRAIEAEATLAKNLKEQEEKELADIQDKPDELSLYRAKQRVRAREAELTSKEQEIEASKAEHEEALAEHRKWKIEQEADKIASEYEELAGSLLIQLTDGSPEKMKLLASQMGTLKAKTPITPRPDSGISSGGAGKLTEEQIEKMPTEDYAEHPSVKARFK